MLSRRINETLKNDMWYACDILRRDNNISGVLQYTEHIAWLLFLKFLDEEEKRRIETSLLGGDLYGPVLQGDLAWDSWASPEKLKQWKATELIQFVRGRLLPGLATLTGAPLARTISRIFSDESVGDQNIVRNIPVCASGQNLKDVIEVINKIHFEREDDVFTITQFYEDLLRRMGTESGTGGEFHTPRPVMKFMVEVIDPQIGETIYDPAFGSAGFLAQAYLHMEPQVQTTEQRDFLQYHAFHGQEKKGVAALLGVMNLALHGVSAPDHLVRANTLEENVKGSVEQRYDIILTNPPFGGTEGRHIQENFTVKNNATELLFLQHIIKKLKQTPNARCAMVIPEGTLFRGEAFAEVKKILLDEFHLFAVVSLPQGTFAPYSDVKTALLFFQRPDNAMLANPKAREETWYYEISLPEDLQKFSKGNPIEDWHFSGAREAWQKWISYLQRGTECPFEFADDIRDRWQAHFVWDDYRRDQKKCQELVPPDHVDDDKSIYWDAYYITKRRCDSLSLPTLPENVTLAYQEAHLAKGPRPSEPYTTWVEKLDDFMSNGYDLSPHNPNSDERIKLPYPEDVTIQLYENIEELNAGIQRLSKNLSSGNGNGK